MLMRIVCVLTGYVCGLFQTSYILGKLNGIDIREHGYDAGRIAEYICGKVCQMGTVPI